MGRRLLYITNGIAGAGGLERVLSVRTRLLAERYGDEIHILTLNEEGKEPFYDFWPGIHVHDVRMQGNPAARLKAWASGVRKAVRAVKQWVETHSSWDETLLIVTTDHGNALPLHPDSAFQAFAPMNNAGAGNVPLDGVDVRYWSTQHTNELARLWAKGNGTDAFAEVIKGADYDFTKIVVHNDTVYYVDNTDIFNVAKRLLTLQAE